MGLSWDYGACIFLFFIYYTIDARTGYIRHLASAQAVKIIFSVVLNSACYQGFSGFGKTCGLFPELNRYAETYYP
jgi:hypothetical protein